MKIVFSLLIIVLVTFQLATCAKILGVFPIAARSHYILGSALMKGLAEKGHDVTIITPYREKNLPKNGSYKEIFLPGVVDNHEQRRKDIKMFDMADTNILLWMPFFLNMMNELTEFVLTCTTVQELLQSDEQFDVVIVEQFLNDAHKGFASHFNAPLILLSTIGANQWVNDLVGNPAPTSYVPNTFLGYSSNMTFWERTFNTFQNFLLTSAFHLFAYPQQARLFNKYFGNRDNFYDVLYNASVVLLNSHQSTNEPVPYVPNMIDIGGYHVQPSKQLPDDLKKFLDDAKEGVIYFSMGSNLRSAEFPPEKRDAFLKTFAKLKQKVLWKWEEDVLPGQPENVKLGKWLPQQDILAHPNIKLFITHGGLLSTTETIYHGVPVLTIPIAADQKLNAKRIVNDGFGLTLHYKEISERALTDNLNELLNNPKYYQNAKKRSQVFHDRLVAPMDTAAYWVEYVIRHGGAPHLKVAGVDLPWYKYFVLDVIAFMAVVALLGLYISFKTVKILSCKFCRSKPQKLKRN